MQFSLSRVSKFITVLATLFVCLHSAAGPKEYEWDKLGYWSAEIGRLAVGTPSWKFQAFASPQLVCDDYVNLSRSLFSNTPKYDLKACPTTDAEIFVCRSPELECPDKATAFNDGGVDARPICYQQPLAKNAQKGARGLSGYNFNTGKCNCNNFGGGANKTLFSTK